MTNQCYKCEQCNKIEHEDIGSWNQEPYLFFCSEWCHIQYIVQKYLAVYTEQSSDKPCYMCMFCGYDSFFDEHWCKHNPPPYGINDELVVNRYGTCEYFTI